MTELKPRRKGSLMGRVLRILRISRILEDSPGIRERNHADTPTSNYPDYGKKVETAWLEAERARAEMLMEWQNRRLIC